MRMLKKSNSGQREEVVIVTEKVNDVHKKGHNGDRYGNEKIVKVRKRNQRKVRGG